mmetsp:Transcript_94597/g.294522  ORF Transcript_94597/g.294522 Transcript_94597/m.294522 type:complete len:420 (-) Transcript_94597:111-1370(-)
MGYTDAPNSARFGGRCHGTVESTGGDHRQWAQEAFTSLVGPDGRLTCERILGRPFAAWFRSLIVDMVAQGELPPSKSIRTSRIVALLAKKAASSQCGCLSFDEFDTCTRVVTSPSPGCALEEELTWILLSSNGESQLQCEHAVEAARALWTSIGVSCSDEDAQQVIVAANEEDNGLLTAQRYHDWFQSCCQSRPRARGSARPPSKASAPGPGGAASSSSTPRARPSYFRGSCHRDQLLRSAEVSAFSLFKYAGDRPLDLSESVRCPAPTHPSHRERPGRSSRAGAADGDAAAAGSASLRQPAARKAAPLDWEAQEEWWNQKANRLLPYMRVKASYRRHDGAKAEAVGTLLTGWGIPNKANAIPHSQPPEGARCREASPQTVLPGLTEAAKRKDTERFVVVLINGVERLVPRKWVSPVEN